MILAIAGATFASVFLGGLFALRWKDKLHLILGFSAGAIIGVALFDLLPEALSLAGPTSDVTQTTSFVALGFLIYLILDRLIFHHSHAQSDGHEHCHHNGGLGAGSLIAHSFLDGAAIGAAFQVAPGVGLVVALAVLTHNYLDGINIVSFVLKNHGSRQQALNWLIVGSLAPVLGLVTASTLALTSSTLGLVLALFAGFFLYIGASDLLPESHHSHPTVGTTIMTIVGFGFVYGLVKIIAFWAQ